MISAMIYAMIYYYCVMIMCHNYYLKLYLRSIRNRDWDKLNREKEDLFMRESKMGDSYRHLNSKLFVPNNYSPIQLSEKQKI